VAARYSRFGMAWVFSAALPAVARSTAGFLAAQTRGRKVTHIVRLCSPRQYIFRRRSDSFENWSLKQTPCSLILHPEPCDNQHTAFGRDLFYRFIVTSPFGLDLVDISTRRKEKFDQANHVLAVLQLRIYPSGRARDCIDHVFRPTTQKRKLVQICNE
jgi:hypothetical protein